MSRKVGRERDERELLRELDENFSLLVLCKNFGDLFATLLLTTTDE